MKAIPSDVIKLIDQLDQSIDPKIFEDIANSKEMRDFAASLKMPQFTEPQRISVLLQNVKINMKKKCNGDRMDKIAANGSGHRA